MDSYKVLISESVDKYIEKLDSGEREKIIKRLKMLRENPHSIGEPRGSFWILKVGASGYRIAYQVHEKEKIVHVTAIEQRSSPRYWDFYR